MISVSIYEHDYIPNFIYLYISKRVDFKKNLTYDRKYITLVINLHIWFTFIELQVKL